MTKSELRQALLNTRRVLPFDLWQESSLNLCHHLQDCSLFTHARTVLGYFSTRREPDLSSLFGSRQWGFPRCVGKSLIWHVWSEGLPLQTGAYGISEPNPDLPQLAAESVDLILLPAIACDFHGYRLGYGGGFYDRLLSQVVWNSKPTIAITFDFARLPILPTDPWDKPVDAVATESGVFFVSKDS